MNKYRLCSGIGTAIVLVVILCILPFTIPKIMGFEIYGILSGSMEPICPTGSLVYVKRQDPISLKAKDIVTYQKSESFVITHRIVQNNTQEHLLITKGDANDTNDVKPVSYDRVIGKVVCTIPFLGWMAAYLQGVVGISVIIILLAIGFIFWIVGDMMKTKHKKTNTKSKRINFD